MQLDDRVTITTPEGIELELQLAGVGSRCIAGMVDLIIQLAAIVALVLVTGAVTGGGNLNVVAFVLGSFLLWFAYPIAFELLNRGRTPGKQACHLRVVRETGAAVDPPASAIRDLVRLVDGPLLLWLPSIVGIAVTRQNQRPGDIAAGTLVIRYGEQAQPGEGAGAGSAIVAGRPFERSLPAWDVTAVTPEELATVRRFLARRDGLDPAARAQLAHRLAQGLAAKTAGSDRDRDPEWFLEALVELKSRRG